jgi:hypothetical protein
MKNNRGTHVGVILSFLIFVTFLAFLYSITEPATRVSKDKLDLLEYLKTELLNEFKEDLSTLTIDLNESGCVIFEEFDAELRGQGVVAKDDTGNLLGAHHQIDGKTEISGSEEGILKLYYSEEFSNGTDLGCTKTITSPVDYEIKIFRTTQEIFNSTIIRISENINENITYYKELKEKLGAAFDDEFGFTFSDGEGDVIVSANEKNVSVDIYAEEIPIQYLDNEANINPGFLSVRVW